MNVNIKRWLRPWIPPAIRDLLRGSANAPVELGRIYSDWESARADAGGYDDAAILERVLVATARVISGESSYERDSVNFDEVHVAWPVLAGLLWAADRDDGRLHVIDFGGSLGTTFRQNRGFFGASLDVRWGVVEQAHYVAAGRQMVEDDRLSFHEDIDACVTAIGPNIVMLGAVLQYLDQPYTILGKLAGTTASVIIIDRTPFSAAPSDQIAMQTVPPSIYPATYPSWIFSTAAFHARIPSPWKIVADFDSADGDTQTAGGLVVRYRGMILAR